MRYGENMSIKNGSYIERITDLRKAYNAEVARITEEHDRQTRDLNAALRDIRAKDYGIPVTENVNALCQRYDVFYDKIKNLLEKYGEGDFLASLSASATRVTAAGLFDAIDRLAGEVTQICADFEKTPAGSSSATRLSAYRPLLERAKALSLSLDALRKNLPALLKNNPVLESARKDEIDRLQSRISAAEKEAKEAVRLENLSVWPEFKALSADLAALSAAPVARLSVGKYTYDRSFRYLLGFLRQKIAPEDITFLKNVMKADTSFLDAAPIYLEPETGKHNILVNLHEKDFSSEACRKLIFSIYLSIASRLPGNSLRFGAFLCDTNASYIDLSFLYEKIEKLGTTAAGKEGEYVAFPLAKEAGRYVDQIDRLQETAYRAAAKGYYAFNRAASGDLMPAYLTYYYKYPHTFGEVRDCASRMRKQIEVRGAGFYNVIFQDVDADFSGYAKKLEADDIDAVLIDMTDLRDIRIDGRCAGLDIAEEPFDTDACFSSLNDYYTRKSQFLIDDFFTTVREERTSRSLFHGDTRLRVPLGMRDNRVYEMEFDLTQLCHSLFIGRSGSGKTSILHSFILSIMNAYSPKEVAIYLADYKGNEFSCYRENAPHVRYLLCKNGKKSDNETTFYSMFQSIRKIHEERSILIRQKGVNNFLQYNETVAEAEKMPFIFFIVDEYNSLLDDFKAKYGSKLINLINELTRMVRSSGICVMLSGQTLEDKLNLDNIQYKFIVSADTGSLGTFFNVRGDTKTDLLQFLSIPKEGRVLVGTAENSVPAKVKVPYCGENETKQRLLLDICRRYSVKETHTVIGGESDFFGVSQYTDPAYRTMADPVLKRDYTVSPDELDYDPYDTSSFPVYVGVSSTDMKPVSLEFSSSDGSFGYTFFTQNADRLCAMLRSACFGFVYKTALLKQRYDGCRVFYFGTAAQMRKTVGVYCEHFPFLRNVIDCINVETEGARALSVIKRLSDSLDTRSMSDVGSLAPYLLIFDGLDFFQRPDILDRMLSDRSARPASGAPDEVAVSRRMDEIRAFYRENGIPFTEAGLRNDAIKDLEDEKGAPKKTTTDISGLTATAVRNCLKNLFNFGSTARVFTIAATGIARSFDDFIHDFDREKDYANCAVFGTMEETVSVYGDRMSAAGGEISTCIVNPSEIKTRLYSYSHIRDAQWWESLQKML